MGGARVADLPQFDALAGLLPVQHGAITLAAAPQTELWAVAPFGPAATLARLFATDLPAPGRSAPWSGGLLLWAGWQRWFVTGGLPDGVAKVAATTAQTDAWAVLRLTGPAPETVLARLVPVDLRMLHFGTGAVARTLLGQIAVLIHRPQTAPEALELWLPRSMAAHGLQSLREAMRAQVARG